MPDLLIAFCVGAVVGEAWIVFHLTRWHIRKMEEATKEKLRPEWSGLVVGLADGWYYIDEEGHAHKQPNYKPFSDN